MSVTKLHDSVIIRVPGDLVVIISVHLTDHVVELKRKLKAAAQGLECTTVEAGISWHG